MNKQNNEKIAAWYGTPLGQWVLSQEYEVLKKIWTEQSGDTLLQLSLGAQAAELLRGNRYTQDIILTPELTPYSTLVGDFTELPLMPESVNMVMIYHWLGMSADPQEALEDVYRILAPQGKVIVCGISPAWFCKFYKRWHDCSEFPYATHSLTPSKTKRLLKKTGFSLQKTIYHSHGLSLELLLTHFSPTVANYFHPLHYLSTIGLLNGGGYMVIAEKNIRAITPIGMVWNEEKLDLTKQAKPTYTHSQGLNWINENE